MKPQFEASPAEVGRGGVVRDPAVRAAAVRRVADALRRDGGVVLGAAPSRLAGPKGNREVFLLAGGAGAGPPCDLDATIDEAVR